MQPNKLQQEAIERLARSGDADLIASYFKDVIKFHADVRNMQNITPDEVRGRQLACQIIEDVVSRIARHKESKKDINSNDDYS